MQLLRHASRERPRTAIILTCAVVIGHISKTLDLLGSTTGAFIVFAIPGAVFLKLPRCEYFACRQRGATRINNARTISGARLDFMRG